MERNAITKNKCLNIKIDLTDSSDFVMWNFKNLNISASIQTMNRSQQVFIKKNNTEIFQIFTVDALNLVFLKQRKDKHINFISMSYLINIILNSFKILELRYDV